MNSNIEFENIIKESRQEVRNIVIHLLTNDFDIETILYVLKISRSEIEEIKSAINEDSYMQGGINREFNRKRLKARKFTKFPSDYKSNLSKENERAIKLIRSLF
ncbi:hypothetical protein GWK91_16205 [Virgibacillus sp. MSP4-1]|uniref:hypothetical protein n=1 Tax=Virgibacillus sp. MSP4-1 TaxID=2700081 RepID=UPI0005C57F2D|nr:hypothetical protein [Virgibacillus sp. MSP4-1]QHS24325.1 hypothetical protein GWK91_16205 [Virgibacillus sp. MSP4-1]